MIRIITISLILLTLHSCTPARVLNEFTRPSLREPSKKEARQQARHERRGQRKLARLLRSHPELQRIDSITTPISIITPARMGNIILPARIGERVQIVRITEQGTATPAILEPRTFSADFADSLLSARFSLKDGIASLDYTIRPQRIDTSTTTPCTTIQPTQYIPHPLSWWQRLWIGSGKIAWIILIIIIATRIINRKLNAG